MVELNAASLRFYVDGKEVHLTKLELRLMRVFLTNPDRAYEVLQLEEIVYGEDWVTHNSNIRSLVRNCRKALGPYRNAIETIYGFGYRFNPQKCETKVIL